MGTYGLIHCHSEHSLKDGAMSVSELVTTAKKMGAKAVTLTDHGSCTGIITFLKKAKSEGIKGIPGVEMYIRNDEKRNHLLLLAKNTEGYREISRAVSISNQTIEVAGSYSFPVLREERLFEFFGNGNVIATSACVSGPIANILLSNYYVEKEISKLEKRRKKYQYSEQERQVLFLGKQEVEQRLKNLEEEYKKYSGYIKPSRQKKGEKALSVLIETQISFSFINDEEQEKIAKEKLPILEEKINFEKSNLKKYNAEIKKINTKAEKYKKLSDEIADLKNKIQNEELLYQKAKSKVLYYKSIFGDDFYLEIQYHGLDMEKQVYPTIVKLAKETGTLFICTNDAHISTPDKVPKREFLRSLQNNKFEAATIYDQEMYLKTDAELKLFLSKIFPENVLEEAFRNVKKVCDQCEEVDIFKDEKNHRNLHYPVYIENGVPCEDSAGLLRKKAFDGISNRFSDMSKFTTKYMDRLEYELNVIISMGYADYLLIVQDYVNYGKWYGKTHCPEKVAYTIGPGRGSAAGSLVCYLIGITCLDPIKYNLYFERFLNKDRVSMPDIDVDFAEEVREACIEYVRQKYGIEQVVKIRTEMTQAARACIRNAARILSDKYYHDTSVLYPLGDKIAKSIPPKQGVRFSSKFSEGSESTVSETLLQTYTKEKHAKEIIELAIMGEGSITNLGVHAAGVLISDGHPISDYIPLFHSKTGWAASCDMIECEDIGLLKMDVRIVR